MFIKLYNYLTSRTTGDYMQKVLPALALVVSLILSYKDCLSDYVIPFVIGTVLIQVFKFVTYTPRPSQQTPMDNPWRWRAVQFKWSPNDGDSFMSGHTGAAFGGAWFIALMTPLWIGLPIMLLASTVGLSRILCKAHYVRDVVGSILLTGLVQYIALFWF